MSWRAALLLLASAPALAHASGPGLGTLLIIVVIPALIAGAVYGALCGAIRVPHKVAIPLVLALFLSWLTYMMWDAADYTKLPFVPELIKTWLTMTLSAGIPFLPAYYATYSRFGRRQAPAAQDEGEAHG